MRVLFGIDRQNRIIQLLRLLPLWINLARVALGRQACWAHEHRTGWHSAPTVCRNLVLVVLLVIVGNFELLIEVLHRWLVVVNSQSLLERGFVHIGARSHLLTLNVALEAAWLLLAVWTL